MKVLVSWSDMSSKLLAEALNDWLPLALPNTSPVMPRETPSESQWLPDRLQYLREAQAGIVCVTRSALDSNWVFFELGALRRYFGTDGIVAPVLLDLIPGDVSPTPLHVFQATRVTRSDMLGLVRDINRQATPSLTDRQVEVFFERAWDDFFERTKQIPGYELKTFVVTVKLPSQTASFTFKPTIDRSWDTIEKFILTLPRSPLRVTPFDFSTLHFLDVTSQKWEEPPARLSRMSARHVAFIDPGFVDAWRGNSHLAAEFVQSETGPKPPDWTVTQMGDKLVLTRGMQW